VGEGQSVSVVVVEVEAVASRRGRGQGGGGRLVVRVLVLSQGTAGGIHANRTGNHGIVAIDVLGEEDAVGGGVDDPEGVVDGGLGVGLEDEGQGGLVGLTRRRRRRGRGECGGVGAGEGVGEEEEQEIGGESDGGWPCRGGGRERSSFRGFHFLDVRLSLERGKAD